MDPPPPPECQVVLYDTAGEFLVAALQPTFAEATAAAAAVQPVELQAYKGMSDPGTTVHLTNQYSLLSNPRTVRGLTMKSASPDSTVVTHVGELRVAMRNTCGTLVSIPPTMIYYSQNQPFTLIEILLISVPLCVFFLALGLILTTFGARKQT